MPLQRYLVLAQEVLRGGSHLKINTFLMRLRTMYHCATHTLAHAMIIGTSRHGGCAAALTKMLGMSNDAGPASSCLCVDEYAGIR